MNRMCFDYIHLLPSQLNPCFSVLFVVSSFRRISNPLVQSNMLPYWTLSVRPSGDIILLNTPQKLSVVNSYSGLALLSLTFLHFDASFRRVIASPLP